VYTALHSNCPGTPRAAALSELPRETASVRVWPVFEPREREAAV
jgi:hypothetical protein